MVAARMSQMRKRINTKASNTSYSKCRLKQSNGDLDKLLLPCTLRSSAIGVHYVDVSSRRIQMHAQGLNRRCRTGGRLDTPLVTVPTSFAPPPT